MLYIHSICEIPVKNELKGNIVWKISLNVHMVWLWYSLYMMCINLNCCSMLYPYNIIIWWNAIEPSEHHKDNQQANTNLHGLDLIKWSSGGLLHSQLLDSVVVNMKPQNKSRVHLAVPRNSPSLNSSAITTWAPFHWHNALVCLEHGGSGQTAKVARRKSDDCSQFFKQYEYHDCLFACLSNTSIATSCFTTIYNNFAGHTDIICSKWLK